MSLVEERVLDSLESLASTPLGVSEESESLGLFSLMKFAGDVQAAVNALIMAGRLEGARLRRLMVRYEAGQEAFWAHAMIVFEGFTFYLYAKPYIEVHDVDYVADTVARTAESTSDKIVPIIAGYTYSYDAERYAKSIEIELLKLGL